MIRQRGLTPADRPALLALLESLASFSDEERSVALELADAAIARPNADDYRFILSFDVDPAGTERLAGYVCYGRTPMTQAAYDLYWIATSPDYARSGIARGLLASMDEEIMAAGGGIIRVETGSREGYEAAAHFYDALGFARAANIQDFYASGDDLLIFTKRVSSLADRRGAGPNGVRVASLQDVDEPALVDLAFGYRDYEAERDFLLACARQYGKREVDRVLAWACGPGRHLLAFADIGISGVGVDGDKQMVAYARKIAGPRIPGGPEIALLRAELDEVPDTRRVDLSFVPLSSIHYLTTSSAVETHLHHAASLLEPGGVHVIEATHPSDLTTSGVNHTEWSEVRGEVVIDARFRIHIDRLSPERRVPVTLEVLCSTKKNGNGSNGNGAPKPSLKEQDEWYVPELAGWREMIAKVPEFELVATLGDFNVDVPFEHSAAWRLILVLRRT